MYAFRIYFTTQIIIKYKEHDEVCQVFLMNNTAIECKLIRYSGADVTESRVVNSQKIQKKPVTYPLQASL